MDSIGEALGFDGRSRWVRCFGHIINLVSAALLFGANYNAFEQLLDDDDESATKKHKEWQKKGPIGKLVTILMAIHRFEISPMGAYEYVAAFPYRKPK